MRSIKNLTRFIESGSIENRLLKKVDTVTLNESLNKCNRKLRESLNECPEGWWVPISFYNKLNGNGRNYPQELWANVIDNQRDIWQGSPCLVDHPSGDSDGTPEKICGVWIDAKMDSPEYNGSGMVWGLLVPSGHHGADLKDHLKNGLKVGTSSSGFGKLMNDGETVDPDTYVIERLADWVLTPSQSTYFGLEDSQVVDRSIYESKENTENKLTEKATGTFKNMTKLEEKKLRRDMKAFLEDATKITNPQERLKELKDIEELLESGACPDLREQIEEKIKFEESEIAKLVNDGCVLKEELGIESADDLKTKLTTLNEDYNQVKSESNNWKEIANKLQARLTNVNKINATYRERVERLTDKVNSLKEKLNDRPTNSYVDYLKEKNSNLSEELSNNIVLNESLKNENDNLKTLNEKYNTELKDAHSTQCNLFINKKLAESKNESKSDEYNTLIEKCSMLMKAYNKLVEKNKNLTKALIEQRKNLEESTTKNVKILNKVSNIHNQIKEAQETKESVENFYNDIHSAFGDWVEDFQPVICGSKSLKEAQNKFIKIKLDHSKSIRAKKIKERKVRIANARKLKEDEQLVGVETSAEPTEQPLDFKSLTDNDKNKNYCKVCGKEISDWENLIHANICNYCYDKELHEGQN